MLGQYTRNNNPYSATYNQGWKNHSNLSYGNKNIANPMHFQGQASRQQPSTNLEEVLTKISMSTNNFIEEARANFRNQAARLHDLEIRMGKWLTPIITGQLGHCRAKLKSTQESNVKP